MVVYTQQFAGSESLAGSFFRP